MMKKSTFGAVLAFLFAAAGALTAAALYLYHREKELDEYEPRRTDGGVISFPRKTPSGRALAASGLLAMENMNYA